MGGFARDYGNVLIEQTAKFKQIWSALLQVPRARHSYMNARGPYRIIVVPTPARGILGPEKEIDE